jgi:hypothetical protein
VNEGHGSCISHELLVNLVSVYIVDRMTEKEGENSRYRQLREQQAHQLATQGYQKVLPAPIGPGQVERDWRTQSLNFSPPPPRPPPPPPPPPPLPLGANYYGRQQSYEPYGGQMISSSVATSAEATINHGVRAPSLMIPSGTRKRRRFATAAQQDEYSGGSVTTTTTSPAFESVPASVEESFYRPDITTLDYGSFDGVQSRSAEAPIVNRRRVENGIVSGAGIYGPASMGSPYQLGGSLKKNHIIEHRYGSHEDRGIYGPASTSSESEDRLGSKGGVSKGAGQDRDGNDKYGRRKGEIRKSREVGKQKDEANLIYGPNKGNTSGSVLRLRNKRFLNSAHVTSSNIRDELRDTDVWGSDYVSGVTNASDRIRTQTNEVYNPEKLKVVGVCRTFEKPYLRLTTAPDPMTVRPESVLKEYVSVLITRWESGKIHEVVRAKEGTKTASIGGFRGEGGDQVDMNDEAYLYVCSQLKAIRQDLMVQHVLNNFTVSVYEKHARIALASGDFNEYNQCQTQLKQFYEMGLTGCEEEFVSYRILYYLQLLTNSKYTVGSSDLLYTLRGLDNTIGVAHALSVREAVQTQKWWYLLNKLYPSTPNQGKYLLGLVVPAWRLRYLQQICRAYRPHIMVTTVLDCLGYDLKTLHDEKQEHKKEAWESGLTFLLECGGSFLLENGSPLVDGLPLDDHGKLCVGPDDGLMLNTSLSTIRMDVDDSVDLL